MEVIFASIFFGMLIAVMIIAFLMLGHSDIPDNSEIDAETAKIILQNLSIPLSRGERLAIDYAIESIEIREELKRYCEQAGKATC